MTIDQRPRPASPAATAPLPEAPLAPPRPARPGAFRAAGGPEATPPAAPQPGVTPPADHRHELLGATDADGQPAVLHESAAYGRTQRLVRRGSALILVVADLLALALTALIAYVLRQAVPVLGHAGDLTDTIAQASWLITAGWMIAIILFGGYDTRLIASGAEILRNVLHASAGAAGIVGAILYLTGIELSRAYFVVLFAVGPVLLLANRYVLRRIIGALRTRGRLRSRVLAVGTLPAIDSIARTVQREQWLGYDLIGAVVPHAEARSRSRAGIPVVGHEETLLAAVRREQPGVLIFAAGTTASADEFRRTAWQLEELDIDVIVVPDLSDISSDRMSMRPVAGLPLVHLELPRSRDGLRVTKRSFDVVTSAVLLLVLSPLLAAIALVVRAADGGPVLFRQERVGRDGVPFTFLKFRSMVPDAEARLEDLDVRVADRGNAVMFKMMNDPRVTRPGRFLRRYSLDELPQLWNVLRGDMSLIGPRPALPHEVSAYDQDALRRLTVRPGITGLWQVSGRSDLSWSETVRLDMHYVDNWSFAQDAQILVRTVRAVLAARGAY